MTELIKVNVALNFSEASSKSPSTSIENGLLPTVLTLTELPRRGQQAYSAGEKRPDMVNHTPCAGREAENGGGSGGYCGSSLSWKSRQELVQTSQAPVVAVPLVWGERSAVVEAFDPEMVVMSDVVYDPAGAVLGVMGVARYSRGTKLPCWEKKNSLVFGCSLEMFLARRD